jgi:Protein of unknown function (DUF642)
MKGVIGAAAAGLLGIAAISSGNAANLVTNGSFESPSVGKAGFVRFCAPACLGQKGFAWTVVGAIGTYVDIIGPSTYNGLHFKAATGTQWLDLSSSGTLAGVQQTIATTPGDAYELRFALGAIYDTSKIWGPISKVDIYVNHVFLTSVIAEADPSETTLAWEDLSVKFTATAKKTSIAFFAGNPPPNAPGGVDSLDDISVESLSPVAAGK